MNRPNILFISAEQQRGDTIHALGADWMITPTLDRLAGESVVFDNAFSCAATCVSSRHAFYSGLYPHNSHVYDFSAGPNAGDAHWTNRLSESGYHCVSIGKTHLPQGGFDESIAEQYNKYQPNVNGEPCEWIRAVRAEGYEPPLEINKDDPDFDKKLVSIEWPLPEHLHPDCYVADRAMEWLDAREGDEPFYLHLGFLGPHDLYDPPKRFLDMYDDDTIPLPDVDEEEKQGIPDELYAQRRKDATNKAITTVHAEHATPERVRRMRKHYYAGITAIDEKLGQVLECLERNGMADNTVVIYTCDHGDHLFDHDLYYKGELYDTIVRIPLMIRVPGNPTAPRRSSDLVSQLDVVRYILEKGGVDGSDLDGIPFDGAVERAEEHPRRYVFAEEGCTGLRPEPNLLAMIRSRTHKLIYFTGNATGQLFDLENDPQETRNQWANPAYAEVRCELQGEMLDWLYRSLYSHKTGRKSV